MSPVHKSGMGVSWEREQTGTGVRVSVSERKEEKARSVSVSVCVCVCVCGIGSGVLRTAMYGIPSWGLGEVWQGAGSGRGKVGEERAEL